ncbi:MAG: hypothetical protein WDZ28_00260 [Simkaniaceae bacterium]
MKKTLPLLLLSLFLTSCASRVSKEPSIVTLQIIDKNGFNETITNKERLKKFESTNFLEPQPYQKAVRVFERKEEGMIPAVVTSYHNNGQIWQYLETTTGRANGQFFEWFPDGSLHIQANVVEGIGDLTEAAQETWVFDGENNVYNEKEQLMASILYDKGSQTGEARYFFESGTLKRVVPYHYDRINGVIKTYNEEGEVIGESRYENGDLNGLTYFKGDGLTPPYEEQYREGLLFDATYWNHEGEVISKIEGGEGEMAVFDMGFLRSFREYQEGNLEGEVKFFTKEGFLESSFMVKEGKKHGKESVYYIPKRKKIDQKQTLKLSIDWYKDEIHGMVKTWYLDGTEESQREMMHNLKHGISFAWYKDGSLMHVEEYEEGKLRKGSYMKKGQSLAVSRVDNGLGTATLFDGEGIFLRRIQYENGKPQEQSSS